MPNRIEREIDEILARLDDFVPEEKRGRRPPTRPPRPRPGAGLGARLRALTSGLTGGHIVLGATVMLLLAVFLRSFGVFPTVTRWATYAGLIVIFGAIFLSIRGPRRSSKGAYWRGQPIELRRPNPLMRLRMWWRRRNHH